MNNFLFDESCQFSTQLYTKFQKYESFIFGLFSKKEPDMFLHKATKVVELIKQAGILINFYLGTLIIQDRVNSSKTFKFKYRTTNNSWINLSNKYFMGKGPFQNHVI